ncbi:hypothetical protein D3C87_2027030 [compost metagenome]
MASPTLALDALKPERSVWAGLPRSTCQRPPSAASTASMGCGGAMEICEIRPSSVICSLSAQDQPWWPSAKSALNTKAPANRIRPLRFLRDKELK